MANPGAEELKRAHIELMGNELGDIYSELWQDTAALFDLWNEYVTVFGTTPQRIKLLNKAAPGFFYHIQKSLEYRIMLCICQLTDPVETGKKKNLTIKCFPSLVSDSISEQVCELVKKADTAAQFCRDWRNRRIAHRDLLIALGRETEALQIANREKLRAALNSIADVLNAVSFHYRNGTTTVFQSPNEGNEGRRLLQVIDSGLKYEAARLERLKKGTYTEEDLQLPKI
jgi:hypothetical protein